MYVFEKLILLFRIKLIEIHSKYIFKYHLYFKYTAILKFCQSILKCFYHGFHKNIKQHNCFQQLWY